MLSPNNTVIECEVKTLLLFDPSTGEFSREERRTSPVEPSGAQLLFSSNSRVFPSLSPNHYIGVDETGNLFMFYRFSSIPFKSTPFAAATSGNGRVVFLPCLNVRDARGVESDDVELMFYPQPKQSIWLILNLTLDNSIMVAVNECEGDTFGTTYHPGLPNVFADGRLCTGAITLPPLNSIWSLGLQWYIDQWLAAWSNSRFNDDLNAQSGGSVDLACRFDPETGKNVPVDDWAHKFQRLGLEGNVERMLSLVLSRVMLVSDDDKGSF